MKTIWNHIKEPPVAKVPARKPNPHEDRYPVADWIYSGSTSGPLCIKDLTCCGVKEIHGVQQQHHYVNRAQVERDGFGSPVQYVSETPETILRGLQKLIPEVTHGRHRPFWIYTVTNGTTLGEELKELIERNGFGEVIVTKRKRNENSGNDVRVYLWTMDKKFLTFDLGKLK